jgi:hypothetical protein
MNEALNTMQFRSSHEEAHFTSAWLTSPCEVLFITFTWHTICTKFLHSSKLIVDRLFSQLASAHARVFASGATTQNAHVMDALSWYLPEALSHAVILALREAYPKEPAHHLDEKLRRQIFEAFVAWTSGFGGQTGRKLTPRRHAVNAAGMPAVDDSRPALLRRNDRTGGAGGRNDVSPRLPLSQLLGAPSAVEGAAPAAADRPGGRADRRSLVHVSSNKKGGGVAMAGGAEGANGGGSAPRRSMVVGTLPPVQREMVDLSARSPLMAHWLRQRQADGDARGGQARESHRMRCSRAGGRGLAQQEELALQGARTFRDVRHEAASLSRSLVSDYSEKLRDTFGQAATAKAHAAVQISALRREEVRVLEKSQTREYANLLCAMRRLQEESDEAKHGREGT